MYVSLYSRNQLQKTKRFLLYAGLFLCAGGAYALIRELFLPDQLRFAWAITSSLILLIGVAWVLIGVDKIHLKDAYFSVTPETINYRLAIFARKQTVFWKDVTEIFIKGQIITLQLGKLDKKIKINLGNVQQPEVALHVSRSLHLIAFEKGISVNGVHVQWAEPTVQI